MCRILLAISGPALHGIQNKASFQPWRLQPVFFSSFAIESTPLPRWSQVMCSRRRTKASPPTEASLSSSDARSRPWRHTTRTVVHSHRRGRLHQPLAAEAGTSLAISPGPILDLPPSRCRVQGRSSASHLRASPCARIIICLKRPSFEPATSRTRSRLRGRTPSSAVVRPALHVVVPAPPAVWRRPAFTQRRRQLRRPTRDARGLRMRNDTAKCPALFRGDGTRRFTRVRLLATMGS